VATARYTPTSVGIADVTLRAARGDWDVTVLDAATGARHGSAATSGSRERTIAATTPGRPLLVLACRRPGAAREARVRLAETPVDLASVASAGRAQLVNVPLRDHDDLDRLEDTGLDVTHNATHDSADVVLYGAADAARLVKAGFTFHVVDANLRRTTQRALAATAGPGLPSGRTTYRTPVDYENDLKKLVADHPGIARLVRIGETIEGRAIEAVELAQDVRATDDGRPTFMVMGVHHAREWPSGEMPMEFAIDLAKLHAAGDPRATAILQTTRVLVLPVLNKDGFEVSRLAGPTPFDDDGLVSLPLALTDAAAYKRKNCRPTAGPSVAPCATRPALQGVDLNRNYGAFWGGVGSSTDPTSQGHRGPAPYSEPESEAIHRLSSTRVITTLITHHTYTAGGTWLRQPGFCKAATCNPKVDVVPDEAGLAALGGGMAQASGWASQLGWAIGQITGATEDWNYFAQGAYGYTPEQRGPNFHPAYQAAVVAEYTGTGAKAQGGVRESLLRAAEQAGNPAGHSIVRGTAPAGRTLRLTKAFDTATSQAGLVVKDKLDFTMTVPASGTFSWHVNPSTRPLSTDKEAYRLTCEAPDGTVLESRDVVVDRGAATRVDLTCAT
jgi:hypothetical protein